MNNSFDIDDGIERERERERVVETALLGGSLLYSFGGEEHRYRFVNLRLSYFLCFAIQF